MKRMAYHSFVGVVFGLMATMLFSTSGYAQDAEAVEPLRVLIVTGGHDFERASFFKMFDSFASLGWRKLAIQRRVRCLRRSIVRPTTWWSRPTCPPRSPRRIRP